MFACRTQLGLMVPSIIYITPFTPYDDVSLSTRLESASYLFHLDNVYAIVKSDP